MYNIMGWEQQWVEEQSSGETYSLYCVLCTGGKVGFKEQDPLPLYEKEI